MNIIIKNKQFLNGLPIIIRPLELEIIIVNRGVRNAKNEYFGLGKNTDMILFERHAEKDFTILEWCFDCCITIV